MAPLQPRVRALLDLSVSNARELCGRHEYDGVVQDLSPSGVAAGLSRVGDGPAPDDPFDERVLTVFESATQLSLGRLEEHRTNPLMHLDNLDLSCYDREYAPAEERAKARRRHLASWPDAVDASLESLDSVSAPVAQALLRPVDGLAAGLVAERSDVEARALAAHRRLKERVAAASVDGRPEAALGAGTLAELLGTYEGLPVDLTELADRAEAERRRLDDLLRDSVERVAPGRSVTDVLPELLADHPDIDGVVEEARRLTEEVLEFTRTSGIAPVDDGECVVGISPESRRWGVAMMAWAAPGEPEGPSYYHVTPPEPDWPDDEQAEWLTMFNRTTLPSITVHEVAPGHFTHGRALRRATGDVRRNLMSDAFAEGWAHYVEEVALEQGFRDGNPQFAVGVALEGLTRVVRLTCSIGLHSGAMDVDEATERFVRHAYISPAGARAEARRGTFDPRYGQYTWGKLELLALREKAREQWGAGFSLRRLHDALLSLGSPPLGLIGEALRIG